MKSYYIQSMLYDSVNDEITFNYIFFTGSCFTCISIRKNKVFRIKMRVLFSGLNSWLVQLFKLSICQIFLCSAPVKHFNQEKLL